MGDQAVNIPMDRIIEPRIVLRLVDRQSVEYLEMADSVRAHGLLSALVVRPSPSRPGFYEIVTGAHRYTVCRELGWETVPCIIKEATDEEVMILQLQENAVRVETKPIEFALHLDKLMRSRPELTIAQVAAMVKKSPAWISRILRLTNLRPETQAMVAKGEIGLDNAAALARLIPSLQDRYVEQARTMASGPFRQLVAQVVKRFTEEIKQGKMEHFYTNEFRPQPYMYSIAEVTAEYDDPVIGPAEVTVEDCRTPLDGWRAALRWVLHLHRDGIEEQRRAFEKRQRTRLQEDAEGTA